MDADSKKVKLSLIIPCYNEEETIQETNSRVVTLVSGWAENKLISGYEIIYVNDGSKDNTLPVLRRLAAGNKNIRVLSFSGNFGHQAALTAGFQCASGDAMVSMDADLQDPPEIIKKMLEKFNEGFEIVYGVRKKRMKDSLFKRLTARGFYKMMILLGVNIVDEHADFRLLSRNVVDALNRYTEVNRFIRGIIPLMGFEHCVVEYEREERFAGKTKYPFKKMLLFAVEGITSFSLVPLRIASLVGLAIFLVTLLLSLWAFTIGIVGIALPGWTSTVLPIYFLGGLQLMFFGIIGEYIGKIYLEVKRRPLFIVKEKCNFEDS
jgi:glycosyltransferase involved in cell wall biosynthesis